MIIIVDSIDRVGKTTLCEKLAKGTGLKIYKHSEEGKKYSEMTDEGETSTMLAMLSLYKLYPENGVIFDRFHLSNTIYGQLYRNYDPSTSFKNFKKIDKVLSDFKDTVLVRVAPCDLERSNREHGKDQTACNELMSQYFNESDIPYKFECTYHTIDETVEKIKNLIEELK